MRNIKFGKRVQICAMIFAATVFWSARAADLIWTGAVSDKWNTTEKNWKDATSGEEKAFASGDNVTFDDTATRNRSVTIVGNYAYSVGNMVVTGTGDYVFKANNKADGTSIGRIDTISSLRKTGSGTVSFSVIADTTANAHNFMSGFAKKVTDGIYVDAGEMCFTHRWLLAQIAAVEGSHIDVASGAILRFGTAGAEMNTYATDTVEASPLSLKINVASGGKFYIADGNQHHGTIGSISLNDAASFVLADGIKGYGKNPTDPGLMTLTGKYEFKGSVAYNWDISKFTVSDAALFNRLHLWNFPLTEFSVEDVTDNDDADLTISYALADRVPTRGTLIPAGLVKTGKGTMALLGKNSFAGNVEVRGGTLCVGEDLGKSATTPANYASTELGALTNDAKTVTVFEGGTLYFPNRNVYGAAQAITNDGGARCTLVFDGGLLKIREGQSGFLPDMTFENGGRIVPGIGLNNNYGRFMVRKNFRVLASQKSKTPFVWEAVEGNLGYQGLALNGYPENVITVEDVTGDSSVDADFYVPLMVGYYYMRAGYRRGDVKFGFTKRGSGTFRYAAPKLGSDTSQYYTFDGDAKITEGTFQVDGDIGFSDTVRVSAGAYLAGTGTVHCVALADGAGWRVPSSQSNQLQINGDLTIGANPVVEVDAPDGFDTKKLKVKMAYVGGVISGAENLGNAVVKVNGAPFANASVRLKDKMLVVKSCNGLSVVVK